MQVQVLFSLCSSWCMNSLPCNKADTNLMIHSMNLGEDSFIFNPMLTSQSLELKSHCTITVVRSPDSVDLN